MITEIKLYLHNIPFPFALYMSTDSEQKKHQIEQLFVGWPYGLIEVRVVPNRGRDIAAKIIGFHDVHERYPYVLHLHTKQSQHKDYLASWRKFIFESLLGTPDAVISIVEMFERCPDLGIAAPRSFPPAAPFMTWGLNFTLCKSIAQRINI